MNKNNKMYPLYKLYKEKGLLPKLKKSYHYHINIDGSVSIIRGTPRFYTQLYSNILSAINNQTTYEISSYDVCAKISKKEVTVKKIEYGFIYE